MSSSSATPETKDPDDNHTRESKSMRMVLVGRTGAGKSSSGNTILGRKAFRAARKASSVTKECWKETEKVADHDLVLVDCPGIFDTSLSEKEFKKEMNKCINMTAPGPHAIVLVIQLGPFTEEEKRSVERIRAIFGEEADKHTIILFTHGDELEGDIEQTVREAGPDLKQLTKSCGERYHVFDNKKIDDRKQVLQFLDKVDDMLTKNKGKYYTSEMFKGVEEKLKDKEEELKKQCEQEIKKLTDKFNEEKIELEETIRQLKEYGQEKDLEIEPKEEQLKKEDRHFKELMRYYELKRKYVRQEVEETQLKENIPKISSKLAREEDAESSDSILKQKQI